jgi:hypothetical protein
MIFLFNSVKAKMQKTQVIKLGFITFEFFHTAKKLIRKQRLDTFILIKFSGCVKEIFGNISHAVIISL